AASTALALDAEALRRVRLPRVPERRGPARADPPVSAVVALALLPHPLLEERLQPRDIQRLECGRLLRAPLARRLAGRVAQPPEELLGQRLALRLDSLEVGKEGLVERVEVRLGVDAQRPGHVVEALERAVVGPRLQRPGERQRLLRPHRNLVPPQLVEELDEHFSPSLCALRPPRRRPRGPAPS